MGYFQVRYDSRVVNYNRRGFIRLATGCDEYNVTGRMRWIWNKTKMKVENLASKDDE